MQLLKECMTCAGKPEWSQTIIHILHAQFLVEKQITSRKRVKYDDGSMQLFQADYWCKLPNWVLIRWYKLLQCNLPILLWPVIKWFTATFILPSIVLPVQRLGFNGDIFPPWGLQGKLWLIIPSPCIFHLHYITLLYHNTFLYGLICK